MTHRILPHTADTGIEATAETLSDLIGQLSRGMFGLMVEAGRLQARQWVEVSVEANTAEELVVDTLSELLWQSEVADLVFCDFRVSNDDDVSDVRVQAGGLPIGGLEPIGPPIKAVTYHDLVVERRRDGWYGRVYFDV